MADTFQLKVVTPDGAVLDKPVASLSATTEAGEITILPEHCLLLSALYPGPMVARIANEDDTVLVLDTGFLEAAPDHVNIISEHCVEAADIDVAAIAQEIAALSAALEEADPEAPTAETLRAQLAWTRALERFASK
jgi:F-type H+-transporting ATPase subunit epsilon